MNFTPKNHALYRNSKKPLKNKKLVFQKESTTVNIPDPD